MKQAAHFSENGAENGGFPKGSLPPEYMKERLEENWHPVDFEVDGKKTLCLYMPAKNEKAVLAFGHGFNANPFSFEKDRKAHNYYMHQQDSNYRSIDNIFNTLNNNGVTVIAAALPIVEPKNRNFIDGFKRSNDAFLFDKNSPVFKLGNPNSPRHALAHSARGLVTLESLNSHKNIQFAHDNFKNVFIMNPMLGITNVTDNYLIVKLLYRAYASVAISMPKLGINLNVRDSVAGTTVFDRLYMNALRIPVVDDLPTHGQIIQMRLYAKSYMKEFNEVSQKGAVKNLTFILGRNDNCTSPRISQKFAKAVGADIRLFDGMHTPLIYDPHSLDYLIETMTGRKIPPLFPAPVL